MSVPDHRKLASYIIMLIIFTAHSLLKDPSDDCYREIVSFTEVGSGEGAGRSWKLPDGVLARQNLTLSQVALGGNIFSRPISFGFALHHGPDYFSPDGEYTAV